MPVEAPFTSLSIRRTTHRGLSGRRYIWHPQVYWLFTFRIDTCGVSRRAASTGLDAARFFLVIIYHVLKQRASYKELGGDYFDKQNTEKQRVRLIRKLELLGVKVTVETIAEAA